MADKKKIVQQVVKGLQDLAVETGKEAVKQAGNMVTETISPAELLGLKSLSPEEEQRKRMEDERKAREESEKLKAQIHGRDVPGEIKQVEQEKEQKKQQEDNVKKQENAAKQNREQPQNLTMESANPAKRRKTRGSAFAKQKRKSQMPDPSQMSQTAEVAGKME